MATTFRKRLTRFLGWWIAAFASFLGVVLLVLTAYMAFFDYAETLRQRLETGLSQVAGAPVRIGSINLDLASYAFELNDISVEGPELEAGSEPILTVDRVWGRLRLSEIVRLRLHWTELRIQGLSVRLVEAPGGGFQFPQNIAATPSLAGADVAFSGDRVLLEDAVFFLSNEEVPWQLEASNLAIELTRQRGGSYKGTFAYEYGNLVIKDHPTIEGSLAAELELASGEIFVHEARGESEVGVFSAKGKLGLAGGIHGRFDVEAEGDLEQAANALLGLGLEPRTVDGPAHFQGMLSVSADSKTIEGTATWPRGSVHGVPFSNWSGEVFWDRGLLQITRAEGEIASGRARLQLDQVMPVADHPASLELELSHVSLADVLFGWRGRPASVDSRLSGRASLSFPARRPFAPDGTFELDGVMPDDVLGGDHELFAIEADGTMSGGDIEIASARLASSTLTAVVAGRYPREGPAELLVDVSSMDLARTDALAREIRRWLRRSDEPDPAMWGIAGRGRARGRLTDRFPHPSFDGEVTAPELRFAGLQIQNLEARATLSRSELAFEDLLGHHGDGVVAGSGAISLAGPSRLRDFDVRLRISEWPATDLATLLESSIETEGVVNGDVGVRRVSDELDGTAELSIVRPTVFGQPFDRAEAHVVLAGQKVRLESARLVREDASLDAALELDVETGVVIGAVMTRDFSLAGTRLGALELDGRLDARAQIDGRAGALVAELDGSGTDLAVNGSALGNATITATVHDGLARLDLDFASGAASELAVDITCRLEGGYPVAGNLVFEALDAAPWLSRISQHLSDAARVLTTGAASFEMSLRDPSSLSADATLVHVGVEGESLQLASLAPVELRYRDGVLHLPTLSLAEGSSRVELGGTVSFREQSQDLRAEGVTDLGVLAAFHPGVAGSGPIDLSARLAGSWEDPSVSGHADLDGATLRLEGFPQPLGGLRGRVVFDNRTIVIPELDGVFGSGPVSFAGALSLDGLSLDSIDITARGTGMRLRYPEGLIATLEADLALVGRGSQQVLSGDLVLTDAVWSREYDLVSGILSDSEGFALFGTFDGDELFENLIFDVSIVAPDSLRLRNSLAEIDASAELELRGTLAAPVLLGTTEARRGEIFFLGQRYDITAGKVDFVDPSTVEPFIELTAETRVRSYRVELRLTGTSDRFYPELSSDPPLRTVDILRLLSGASERDILIGTEEEEFASVGVASLLTERLSQELGRRAERLFGLDRFSIDPFLVGQIANPTARVSLGKQITRDLSVNYSTNLNATTEAIVLIEYTPEGNMTWILSRDEEGDVGIDVKFRKSF